MPTRTALERVLPALSLPVLKPVTTLRGNAWPMPARHVLVVLTAPPTAREVPGFSRLQDILGRRGEPMESLQKTPVTASLEDGRLVSWVWIDARQAPFQYQTLLCNGLKPLLEEHPLALGLCLTGTAAATQAGQVAYVAWINSVSLPSLKRAAKPPVRTMWLQGVALEAVRLAAARAVAEGNALTRALTVLPANTLTPDAYRRLIRHLARRQGWRVSEYPLARLKAMGAGAFVAVAQGSAEADAAIVQVRFRGPRARKRVALVGKGICFDTGGHNLKPARYMYGMHEDMNGSAVVLGILTAISRLRLPLEVECWLALAQNHISPRAYKQNDVVQALNGTTIEIVHTDAEGRMVLADALTLAARSRPDLILDFATLTGSMHTALGSRYSGVFATDASLAQLAVAAGEAAGERVVVFPSAPDYDAALDSKIADIKQCTAEGAADHILATRFLSRFTEGCPWLHMDLSASRNEGGLGAAGSDVTGFGVSWGTHFLDSWSRNGL